MNKILKLFCGCLISCGIAAAFTSCTDDQDPTYLDEVRVSSSYVAIPQAGGSATITLTAKADWSLAQQQWIQGKDTIIAATPQWLTVSAAQGAAGTTEITFRADATDAARECELQISCGGKTQRINVLQYAEETEPVLLTVTEALNLINAGTQGEAALYVKGIVCKIVEISPQYGNATYYISDDGTYKDGTWLEIYRGKWLNGDNFTKGNEFSVGDELVIKGVLINYGGNTPETKQGTCEVISFTPSLIKVDSLDVTELPLEGGITTAAVVSKGAGITIDIPAEAQSWLSVAGITTDGNNMSVKFKAAPNTGGDRSTTVTFKTTDTTGKVYSAETTISQKGAILEVSVSDFLAAQVGDTQYRVTGIVTELYASDSQGQSFYVTDHTGTALVYRAAGFKESGAKVGDVVTVVGKRGAYNDNPQLTSGTFEALKYSVETVTIAQFREVADDKEKYYMISGVVSEATEDGTKNDVTQYGNFNLTDATGSVYVYGVTLGWGGAKGQFGGLGIDFGDNLTIVAYKTTYKGLVEAVGMYFSHEKAKADNAPGTVNNPFTVAEVIKYIDEGGKDDVYVKGKVSKIQSAFSEQYHTAIFWISEDGVFNDDPAKDFEAYSVYWLGNKEWTEGMGQIAEGDEVVLCGKVTKYKTTYETSSKKAYVYSINGKTE